MQFQCQQLNALMTLGYKEDFEITRLVHMRNATIPIGCACACVMDSTTRLETLTQHFVEN